MANVGTQFEFAVDSSERTWGFLMPEIDELVKVLFRNKSVVGRLWKLTKCAAWVKLSSGQVVKRTRVLVLLSHHRFRGGAQIPRHFSKRPCLNQAS